MAALSGRESRLARVVATWSNGEAPPVPLVQVEDVSQAVVYLTSDEPRYVTE